MTGPAIYEDTQYALGGDGLQSAIAQVVLNNAISAFTPLVVASYAPLPTMSIRVVGCRIQLSGGFSSTIAGVYPFSISTSWKLAPLIEFVVADIYIPLAANVVNTGSLYDSGWLSFPTPLVVSPGIDVVLTVYDAGFGNGALFTGTTVGQVVYFYA